MKAAFALANARFWVRPYEFEGDGSTGAAADVVTLEVAGKTRTFWLKALENRLFFREVGRDEDWNFGALEELDEAEKSDLPAALAKVLASENYGRVVLPVSVPRPCFLLVSPDGRIRCGVPQSSPHAIFERKAPHTMWTNRFLDWKPGAFHVIGTPHLLKAKVPDFMAELAKTECPLIDAHWAAGSQQEWENLIKAFFHEHWSQAEQNNKAPFCVLWELDSACSTREMDLDFYRAYLPLSARRGDIFVLHRDSRRLLRFIETQFRFVGQQANAWDYCAHLTLRGAVNSPTHHEILEAHLFLRGWIHQRLPPEQARQWLEFS